MSRMLLVITLTGLVSARSASAADLPRDCGENYMLLGERARLGSHTFFLFGPDGPNHVLAAHRSGTPPHNYQFVLRLRLDDDEMAFYKELARKSKLPPSFTTIHYNDKKEKLSRTFFCLQSLPEIFGTKKKAGDQFESLFPINGSLLKDADHQTGFRIIEHVHPGGHFSLERDDVELLVYRYLPSYLPQKVLKKQIRKNPQETMPRFSHAPLYQNEPLQTAMTHSSYRMSDADLAHPSNTCRRDYLAKMTSVSETIHTFLLLAEADENHLWALHYYDQAPHNFQTLLKLKVDAKEMKLYRRARTARTPPLLQTRVRNAEGAWALHTFCMANFPKVVADQRISFSGTVFKDSEGPLGRPYRLGSAVGSMTMDASDIEVVIHRNLISLLDPLDVAREVLGASSPEIPARGFADLKQISPTTHIDMRYAGRHNFVGRPITGYRAPRCFLTAGTARALGQVQSDLEKDGYGLLVHDCYRPQRAVDDFFAWSQDKDERMKRAFYPDIPKTKLFELGYIAKKSGHSRGNTVDLTLVRLGGSSAATERPTVCEEVGRVPDGTGRLPMGTPYDCFSPASATASSAVSSQAQKYRKILKEAMHRRGFRNYKKEWWHYTYKADPRRTHLDFIIQ